MSELLTASLGMRTHATDVAGFESVHRLGQKKGTTEGVLVFLVEAAGFS